MSGGIFQGTWVRKATKKKPVKIVMSIWNEERFSGTPGNPEGEDKRVGGM